MTVPIETHERVDELSGEWDELVADVRGLPWLRPGWIDAWWRAFGEGSLRIVTTRDGARLTGVLPLFERGGVLELDHELAYAGVRCGDRLG